MKKILIIEDDKNLQEGLAFSLKLEKYEILTASTIKQSMEFLQSEKIDWKERTSDEISFIGDRSR